MITLLDRNILKSVLFPLKLHSFLINRFFFIIKLKVNNMDKKQ